MTETYQVTTLKPRYDIKQNYSESIRNYVILGFSSIGACACLYGLASSRLLHAKALFAATGVVTCVMGKVSGATLRERVAILNDIEDVSGAARTSEIAADMSPIMTQQPTIMAMPASAIDTTKELRRAQWLQAKELNEAGTTKFDIISSHWKYKGDRYPVGQDEWRKLELEFGSIDKPQTLS